jgi:hypothetical protein
VVRLTTAGWYHSGNVDDAMKVILENHHIEALKDASRMLRRLLYLQRAEMHEGIVSAMRTLFAVEYAALFLHPYNDKGFIVLERASPKRPTGIVRLPITTASRSGLTGFFASQEAVITYDFHSIKRHANWAGSPPAHLPSLECNCVMAIPVLDRKKSLLALIKLENKLDGNGQPAPDSFFTAPDIAMAEIISEQIASVLESSYRRTIILNAAQQLATSASPAIAFRVVLDAAIALVRADRADFSFLDESKQRFVIAEQAGAPSEIARSGDAVPEKGVVYALWESGELHRISRSVVPGQPGYVTLDPRVRSELALVCRVDGRRRAVINVESFQSDWFDDHDVPLLQVLEPLAARAIQMELPGSGDALSGGWPADPPGVAWLRLTRRHGKDRSYLAQERVYASVSSSFHEIFGVGLGARKESYFQNLADSRTARKVEDAMLRAVLENDREIEKFSGLELEIRGSEGGNRAIQAFFQIPVEGALLCTVRDLTHLRTAEKAEPQILPSLPVCYSRADGSYQFISPVLAQIYGFGSVAEPEPPLSGTCLSEEVIREMRGNR